MFAYEKRLQFPVKIKNTNPDIARLIMSQYGGPDGELGASLRYLSQRFSMPNDICKAVCNDVGLCVMILLLYAKIGKAYCFQYALPFFVYRCKMVIDRPISVSKPFVTSLGMV